MLEKESSGSVTLDFSLLGANHFVDLTFTFPVVSHRCVSLEVAVVYINSHVLVFYLLLFSPRTIVSVARVISSASEVKFV